MEERKYCGLNHDDMCNVLTTMCEIENIIELTKEEQDAFDIAIQCVATVLNRMVDDSPIEWDDEDD